MTLPSWSTARQCTMFRASEDMVTPHFKFLQRQFHSVEVERVEVGEMFEMLDERCRCARLKPEVVCRIVVEGAHKTERSIYVLTLSCKVIAIVFRFQQGVCLVGCNLRVWCIFLDTRTQDCVKFFLGNAAIFTLPWTGGWLPWYGYLKLPTVKLKEITAMSTWILSPPLPCRHLQARIRLQLQLVCYLNLRKQRWLPLPREWLSLLTYGNDCTTCRWWQMFVSLFFWNLSLLLMIHRYFHFHNSIYPYCRIYDEWKHLPTREREERCNMWQTSCFPLRNMRRLPQDVT